MLVQSAPAAPEVPSISDREVRDIAVEAYVYAYPPINQFYHMRAIPDASFTDVVRPNADTLYSTLWFDVEKEPLVISVPDSDGRYYLLPLLDMWTDIFASPGKRTTGTSAQTFAIVGPTWRGVLPEGVAEVRAPTAVGWLIGRTQIDGPADYPAVHAFQDGMKAVPLGTFGKAYSPLKGTVDRALDMSAPAAQVAKMNAETFFGVFAAATRANPPHGNDYPILVRMQRIGLDPGKPVDFATLSPEVKAALDAAPQPAKRRIDDAIACGSRTVNDWIMPLNPIGTYATDYAKRAGIARFGLGANTLEDAFYPSIGGGFNDDNFDSTASYVVRFAKDQLPPARAFWSLTMYDRRQLFAANSINRYKLGDADKLSYGSDGSLELYLQRESPGKDKEANWLPTPAGGPFSLTMRLYWPKAEATDGTWSPPPVTGAH